MIGYLFLLILGGAVGVYLGEANYSPISILVFLFVYYPIHMLILRIEGKEDTKNVQKNSVMNYLEGEDPK